MELADVDRAVAAASFLATEAKLAVDRVVVLQNSNKVALRLIPCDVFARVAAVGQDEVAAFELEVAQRLADTQSPAAALEVRVAPRVYERDGFAVTFWTYYQRRMDMLSPEQYSGALQRLHAGMRTVDIATPTS